MEPIELPSICLANFTTIVVIMLRTTDPKDYALATISIRAVLRVMELIQRRVFVNSVAIGSLI